jgi:hypothetical protein
MGSLLLPAFVIVSVTLLVSTPSYVIAQRRGLSNPWVAFVPIVGWLIILCESTGTRGWVALLALFPLIGTVIWLGLAFAVPRAHGRRQWWTLALIVPGIGLVGYWFYAFSLPQRGGGLEFAGSVGEVGARS